MILALIDHDRGVLNKLSLEMLTLARGLGRSLEAVVIGADGQAVLAEIEGYGVTAVHHLTHPQLTDYAPAAWGKCVAQLAASLQPEANLAAVLAPGSERGNEVMAHAAAQMDLPLAANCTEIERSGPPDDGSGDNYQVTRIRWGGSLLEEARLTAAVKLLTVAPFVVEAEATTATEMSIHPHTPDLSDKDFRVRVTSRVVPDSDKVSLTDARVVVSGGRGVGSSEGFESLDELAYLLGGAVGCSRVVTNKGWRPHADQVGQTGARVAPDLYIACGISGAIQHWVGCKGAKKILVINTDPEAPIIAKADYAVIADLHEIVPAISEEVRRLDSQRT
jgi:electron transfer flavoprotein alpha subunit